MWFHKVGVTLLKYSSMLWSMKKHVSKLIDELVQVASEEKDNATQDFLWQFVREQVEDEANVLNIVSHLRKAGDSAILFMDAKLGERES